MNAHSDPRANGFNYAGWGPDPKPPVYLAAQKIVWILNKQAGELGAKAWELEETIRKVRLATHAVEKVKAVAKLEEMILPYLLPSTVLETIPSVIYGRDNAPALLELETA